MDSGWWKEHKYSQKETNSKSRKESKNYLHNSKSFVRLKRVYTSINISKLNYRVYTSINISKLNYRVYASIHISKLNYRAGIFAINQFRLSVTKCSKMFLTYY